jgi:glutathione peroxidase
VRPGPVRALFLSIARSDLRVSADGRGPIPEDGPESPKCHTVVADQHLYTVAMSIYDPPLHSLSGEPTSLGDYRGKELLVVNVASKCGLTPQYEGLERLQKTYADRGFSVVGFPCNQFGEQEPGSADEIATFCSTTYGVSFPMFEKIEVNGEGRHPVYEELTATPDADGEAGDIQWNFEKFLVSADGDILKRFRPMVDPEAPEVIDAIEANLPG